MESCCGLRCPTTDRGPPWYGSEQQSAFPIEGISVQIVPRQLDVVGFSASAQGHAYQSAASFRSMVQKADDTTRHLLPVQRRFHPVTDTAPPLCRHQTGEPPTLR